MTGLIACGMICIVLSCNLRDQVCCRTILQLSTVNHSSLHGSIERLETVTCLLLYLICATVEPTIHHAPSSTFECLVHMGQHGKTSSMLPTESKTVDVACSVEETASGAVHLHMKPCAGNRASNVREGSIVVLALSRPPPRGALEWALGGRGRGHHGGTDPPGPAAKKPRCCTIYFV